MNHALSPHSSGALLCLDELVYFQSQSVRWLPPARSVWSHLNGQHQSRHKGRGMDFSEVRQYQPGDDIRSIDWRVTARTGKTHTKLFTEDKQRSVLLYLDLTDSLFCGSTYVLKSVQLAHFAAVLTWLTLAKKDCVGFLIDLGFEQIEMKPSALSRQALMALATLVDKHNQRLNGSFPVTEYDFGNVVTKIQRLCPKGAEIIILSDFARFEQTQLTQLTKLNHHNTLRFIQVFDPLDKGETSYRGNALLTDGQTMGWFNFGSKRHKAALKASFDQHQQQLQHHCLRHGITFSALSAGQPLLTQII